MIILLHGDHIEASRNELNRLKTEASEKEIRQLDGLSIDTAMLIQSLESASLFGRKMMIIIERLFGRLGRQQKKIESLCKTLRASDASADIILWEDKELGNLVIGSLGAHVRVHLFKLPVHLFQFLDNFKPGNTKQELFLFNQVVDKEAPELVFSMLVKRVRQLMQLSSSTSPAGLPGWQLTRLTAQAKSFTMDKLVRLYEALGDAEYSVKSGVSPFSLKQLLEQWILTLDYDY